MWTPVWTPCGPPCGPRVDPVWTPCGLRCPCLLQLGVLSQEKEALLRLWEERRQQYEQCMDLQLFYRDTEQVDNWMSKQEVSQRPPPLSLWSLVT